MSLEQSETRAGLGFFQSLAAFVLGAILLFSLLLILVGLTAPALKVESFYFFTEQYSIWSGIMSLFEQDQLFIGMIILVFSVVFPISKIVLGLAAYNLYEKQPARTAHLIKTIGALSKWSMVDVFAIALVVVVINGRVLSKASIDAGIGMFALGVLLSSLAIHGLERLFTAPR
jgi:paraquat-inducible protein A